MKRNLTYLAVATIIILGCGGGGSGSGDTGDTGLSGIINTSTFSIPAGQTQTASGDLTIVASDAINIAGTLKVNPGVNVTFFANNGITVPGTIGVGVLPSQPGRGYGSKKFIFSSPNTNISSDCTFGPGVNVVFVGGTGATNTVTLTGDVRCQVAPAGVGRSAQGDGGGAILIGSSQALSIATAAGLEPSVPQTVSIDSNLVAGDGGHGGDDVAGSVVTRTTTGISGRGGDGGNVEISAVTSITYGLAATLRPGKGGDGGWVGRVTGSANGHLKGVDGTANSEVGGPMNITCGTGGNAGAVVTTAPTTNGTPTIDPQVGGNGGCPFIKGGNGGPGGNGSTMTITIGLCGLNSDGNRATVATAIELLEGNGGNGTATLPGGNGGTVNLTTNGCLNNFMIDCCRGGNGYDGAAQTPAVAGTNGGNGGTITADGPLTYTYRSFNGGDGGNFSDGGTETNGGAQGTLTGTGGIGIAGFPGLAKSEAIRQITLAQNYVLFPGTTLAGGSALALGQVRNYTINAPSASCATNSVHGSIYINGYGPFADPAPLGCGHGPVTN